MSRLTNTEKIILLLILLTGALLRLYNFSGWSFSNDELSALSRLQFSGFSEMIEKGVKLDDMHPPGVQSFLYILTKTAGNNPFIVRLPFVLMGILSIYVFFLLAKEWISIKGALAATALFSGLIFPILYSQLARPYSPGLLFSMLNIYFLTLIIKSSTDNKKTLVFLIAYAISGAACMYTHYFSFLMVAIAGVTSLFITSGKTRLWLIAAGIGMFIIYIPAFPVFTYHFGVGGLGGSGGWLGPPQKSAFIEYLYFIFNESSLLVAAMFAVVLIFVFKGNSSSKLYRKLSLLFFLLPFAIAYFYSIYKNPVYQQSIMLFSFYFLLIYIFSFFPKLNEFYSNCLIIALLIISSFSTIAEKHFYSTHYFGVFKELVQEADMASAQYGNQNTTFIANVIKPYYIEYYNKLNHSNVKYSLYSCNTPAGIAELAGVIQSTNTDYLSYGWSNTYDPPETDAIIREKFPYLIKQEKYFNSGYSLYSKLKNGSAQQIIYSRKEEFEYSNNESQQFISNTYSFSGKSSFNFKSENEFGPTVKIPVKELKIKPGDRIDASVEVLSEEPDYNGTLVLQVNRGDSTVLWKGVNLKDYKLKPGVWNKLFVSVLTDKYQQDDIVSVYFWNSAKKNIYIDDLSVRAITD